MNDMLKQFQVNLLDILSEGYILGFSHANGERVDATVNEVTGEYVVGYISEHHLQTYPTVSVADIFTIIGKSTSKRLESNARDRVSDISFVLESSLLSRWEITIHESNGSYTLLRCNIEDVDGAIVYNIFGGGRAVPSEMKVLGYRPYTKAVKSEWVIQCATFSDFLNAFCAETQRIIDAINVLKTDD